MLLVSQLHFVYWYNIVLVVLTRSASSVDVECMLSIPGNFKRETEFTA